LEWTNCKTKLLYKKIEEFLRDLRNDEREPIVAKPLAVRLVIVRVQPGTIVIAIHIEQFRIAVRIMQNTISITTFQILE
jgi:DUF1365 family protein